MANKSTRLSSTGMSSSQVRALQAEFAGKPSIAKIGTPDATDEESAIKLANACKKRLNELIEALEA